MKNLTLRLMLALLVLTVGIAWAAEPAPDAVEVEVEATVEATVADTQEPAADDAAPAELPSFEADLVEVGACCVANCFDEMEQCMGNCGSSIPCIQACRQAMVICRQSC